jgi:hypothetical protein
MMVDIKSLSCPHSSWGDAIPVLGLPEGWRDIPGPAFQFLEALEKDVLIEKLAG